MNDENRIANEALNSLRTSKMEICDDEWETFYNNVKNIKHENLNPEIFVELNRFLGIYFMKMEKFHDAIFYFENTIKKLEKIQFAQYVYKDYYKILGGTYYALADIYSQQSNFKKAEVMFDKILFILISERTLLKSNEYFYLYQYRKIDKYLLQNLIEKKIIVNSVRNFNDPFDSLVYHWLENNKKKIKNKMHIQSMIDSFNKIRIGCFLGNFNKNARFTKNILMWSHYADSHKGVCICYKIKKSFLNRYFNKDSNEILTFENTIYKQKQSFSDRINIDQSFLTKQSKWKYENEVRLIYFNPDNKQDYISLEMGSDVEIEQIYFGYRCTGEDKRSIKKLFHGICKEAKIDYSENKDIYTSIKFSKSN